jgi:hypothetical protein
MSKTFTTIEHPIHLRGSAFEGRGYDPGASAFFWRNLEKSLYDAARITVFGSSRRIGRPLKELSTAWALRIDDEGPDTRAGGRVFLALLPKVGEVAPRLFQQRSLFGDDLNPEDTVLDWLGDVTSAVWHEERDSELLDAEILTQLAKYKRSAIEGLDDAVIETRRYRGEPVHLNAALGTRAEDLVQETPPAKIARIKGFLNQMAYLERSLLLNLGTNQKLRVLWEPEDIDDVKPLLGRQVLLEGKLEFRPNGQPLILLADRVREATDRDDVWRELPRSAPALRRQSRRLQPEERHPLEELNGILDGQVSDEEFTRMVEEFSRT